MCLGICMHACAPYAYGTHGDQKKETDAGV